MTDWKEIAKRAEDILRNLSSIPPIKLEGQTLEVKGWCSNDKELSEEIAEAAACLANAEGGMVWAGVRDKDIAPQCFRPCPYDNVNPAWVEERISVLTKPVVTCRAFWLRDLISGLERATEGSVIVVAVPKTSSPELHKFQGVCRKRRDDDCPIEYATSADDYSDKVVPDVGPEAVDQPTLSEILQAIPGSSRYAIGGIDFLRNARLVRSEPFYGHAELLTMAGLLLTGKPAVIAEKVPQAQISFSYLDRSGLSKMERTETLNVFQSVRICKEELSGKVAVDEETIHESIVNSLLHREYRAKAITRITLSEDRLLFENPGSLIGGLTPDNLIRAHPIYRNFRLAEAARQVGLCRKFGDGIDRMYFNCLSRGLDIPFITATQDSFRIALSVKANSAFAKFVRSRAESLDNLDRIIVIKALHFKEEATIAELARSLQRTEEETADILAEMVRLNMVERKNSDVMLAVGLKRDLRLFEPEGGQLDLGF